MATGARKDPYLGFRFRVEIDGIQTAAFSEASIPSSEVTSTDYREGTDPPVVRKLSTMNSYGNLSLKKGLSESKELYNWNKQVQTTGAQGARKSISLILVDSVGKDKARWNIIEAWPTKYEVGGFNSTGKDVMIETLDIVHEGIERVA